MRLVPYSLTVCTAKLRKTRHIRKTSHIQIPGKGTHQLLIDPQQVPYMGKRLKFKNYEVSKTKTRYEVAEYEVSEVLYENSIDGIAWWRGVGF